MFGRCRCDINIIAKIYSTTNLLLIFVARFDTEACELICALCEVQSLFVCLFVCLFYDMVIIIITNYGRISIANSDEL